MHFGILQAILTAMVAHTESSTSHRADLSIPSTKKHRSVWSRIHAKRRV